MEEYKDKKITDYRHYVFVLLILSSYLYAGIVIQTFGKQTMEHVFFISALLLICLAAAFLFVLLLHRLTKQD